MSALGYFYGEIPEKKLTLDGGGASVGIAHIHKRHRGAL